MLPSSEKSLACRDKLSNNRSYYPKRTEARISSMAQTAGEITGAPKPNFYSMSTNHIHGKSRGSSLIHSLLPIMLHSQPQRPPLQTRRTETPHPSGCGRGDGYPTVMRDMALVIFARGDFHNPIFEHLRNNKQFPSLRSTFRCKQQHDSLGHVNACRRTGNKRSSIFHDHDLLFLALYRIAYPKTTAAEINAFLYKVNFGSLN